MTEESRECIRLKKCIAPSYCHSPHTDDSLEDPLQENPEDKFNLYEEANSECSSSFPSDNTSKSDANTKKRGLKPSNCSRKKAKLQRNIGKSYVSQSKSKKNIEEKKLRTACGDKCRLHCKDKINETDRQKLFDAFWNIGDLQRQREFIASNIVPIKPKYRYSTTQDLRKYNNAFHFIVADNKIRVCKTFFISTLDINTRIIRTVLSKINAEGFVESDLRGKHKNHPTVSSEIKDSVRMFIKAIPTRIESHYLRKQTPSEFIEGGKTQADLYRDYKALREEENLPYAHSTMFNKIFSQEFNMSFFIPKKEPCESYMNADDEPFLYDAYYSVHEEEKELAQKEQDISNEKSNIAVPPP